MPTVTLDPTSTLCNGCSNSAYTVSSGTPDSILNQGVREPATPSTANSISASANHSGTYVCAVGFTPSLPSNAVVTNISIWVYGQGTQSGGSSFYTVGWCVGSPPGVGGAVSGVTTLGWFNAQFNQASIQAQNSGSDLSAAQIAQLGAVFEVHAAGITSSASSTDYAAYMILIYSTPAGSATAYLPLLGCG